jgi:hypothetical protein
MGATLNQQGIGSQISACVAEIDCEPITGAEISRASSHMACREEKLDKHLELFNCSAADEELAGDFSSDLEVVICGLIDSDMDLSVQRSMHLYLDSLINCRPAGPKVELIPPPGVLR